MRIGVAALALLLVPLGLPGSAAQALGEAGTVLEDATGDLRVRILDQEQALPDSRFKALDLVGASVTEDEGTFTVAVQVAALDAPPEVPGLDDGLVALNFRHNGQEFRVLFVRALGDQSYYWGLLLKYDPEGHLNFQRPLDVTADAASGTVSATLFRDELLDRRGAAPFPGRELDGFWAESYLRTSQGFAQINDVELGPQWNVRDRMPDTGEGAASFPVRMGLEQSGHAALWSPDPIRASNGAQATFVYNVTAENSGGKEELFELSATGVPAGWQVTIPDPLLRIGAGESVQVAVLASVPFQHAHGTLQRFRLELRSQDDPGSIGRLDLGVRYYQVPQPAGHHNTLFLHSQSFGSGNPLFQVFELGFSGNSGFAYMNTLETDPNDARKPIGGDFYGYTCYQSCPPEVPHVEWHWAVFLEPSLEMGLDFDLQGQGQLSVAIQAPVPIPQGSLGGELIHLHFDEQAGDWVWTLIARLDRSPLADLGAGERADFDFTFAPNPEADRLPQAKLAYLGLFLNYTSVKPSLFTGAEAPVLLPGGVLTLPLFEYRDVLDGIALETGPVRFDAVGAHERLVNPGKTVVFAAKLTNGLDSAQDFDLSLQGTNPGWARLLSPARVSLAPGAEREIRVAVDVPASATDRDAADLVLTAQAASLPEVHPFVRFVAVVDLGHEHADEAGLAVADDDAQPVESPAAALAPLLALAGLALLRRRST